MIETLVPVVLVMNDSYWLPYALESIRGFDRYVIYDAGSKDKTADIIDWFVETENKAEFYVRKLPFVDSVVQGIFRNSMIAEAQANWLFMVDGDEVYSPDDMQIIRRKMTQEYMLEHSTTKSMYGVFRRKEIGPDLESSYTIHRGHHRLYHRLAIWKGPHPGEEPVIRQNSITELDFPHILCYHFHNTIRSPLEADVPLRMYRKNKKTYTPGKLESFNLLEALPLLRKPINNFPVNPDLERLQKACQ